MNAYKCDNCEKVAGNGHGWVQIEATFDQRRFHGDAPLALFLCSLSCLREITNREDRTDIKRTFNEH